MDTLGIDRTRPVSPDDKPREDRLTQAAMVRALAASLALQIRKFDVGREDDGTIALRLLEGEKPVEVMPIDGPVGQYLLHWRAEIEQTLNRLPNQEANGTLDPYRCGLDRFFLAAELLNLVNTLNASDDLDPPGESGLPAGIEGRCTALGDLLIGTLGPWLDSGNTKIVSAALDLIVRRVQAAQQGEC